MDKKPEPDGWLWQHEETGMTGFVQHAPDDDLRQWERMNKPRKIVCPLFRRESLSAFRDAVLEEAAKKCDDLRDEHCRMTQMASDKRDHCRAEGGDGCDFVEAWNDAAAAIRAMKGQP